MQINKLFYRYTQYVLRVYCSFQNQQGTLENIICPSLKLPKRLASGCRLLVTRTSQWRNYWPRIGAGRRAYGGPKLWHYFFTENL